MLLRLCLLGLPLLHLLLLCLSLPLLHLLLRPLLLLVGSGSSLVPTLLCLLWRSLAPRLCSLHRRLLRGVIGQGWGLIRGQGWRGSLDLLRLPCCSG